MVAVAAGAFADVGAFVTADFVTEAFLAFTSDLVVHEDRVSISKDKRTSTSIHFLFSQFII